MDAPSSAHTRPSHIASAAPRIQPSSACGPCMATTTSGSVMNGPTPIMSSMFSATALPSPCRGSIFVVRADEALLRIGAARLVSRDRPVRWWSRHQFQRRSGAGARPRIRARGGSRPRSAGITSSAQYLRRASSRARLAHFPAAIGARENLDGDSAPAESTSRGSTR